MERYLSEVVTPQEVNRWLDGQLKVGIHTGVGSGKNYFINNTLTNVLFSRLERGLFISNRKMIVEQQMCGSSPLNSITGSLEYNTTQWLITQYKYSGKLPNVDILIIDEYHHLVTDSAFNKDINLIIEIIDKLDVPIIFISATPPKLNIGLDVVIDDNTLGREIYEYHKVELYHYKDELESKLDSILKHTNDKVLFYINNSRDIERLFLKYEEYSMVYSSKGNTILAQYIDDSKVDRLITDEMFMDRILFTTKVIDSGVNIIDEDLKHIFIFSYDAEEVVQVVGRKRDNKDSVNIYLKNYNPKELGGHKSVVSYKLGIIDSFRKEPLQTIRRLQGTNESYLLHELFSIDEELRTVVNTTVEENLKREYQLLANITDNTYIKELERVGIYGEDITYQKDWDKLEKYLGELHDNGTVFLSRDDREPFINTINYREDGILKKSLPKINHYLSKRRSNYRVEQFSTDREINGKRKQYRSAWKVVQI